MSRASRIARATAVSEQTVKHAVDIMQAGHPDEAEKILRELLARGPRIPPALHALGLLLMQQRRAAEAVAPLEEAARQAADAVIETNLAVALGQCGRDEEALAWLQRAITRQPSFPHAFLELGELLMSTHRLEEAQAVLKRGLELAPQVMELSLLLGSVLLERGDASGARLCFARLLANAPGDPAALYGMGSALMQEGEFARAAERFQQALARGPSDLQARLSLAACLLELDRTEEALALLREAVAMRPQAYPMALKLLVSSGRGRFWLSPSAAQRTLGVASR